jgi:DMSO reductase anchor subunit
MEIQWSLVLFTALTGAAGWMLACVAVAEFKGICKNSAFITTVVATVIAIVGGCASVTHLSHPERMLEALNHPTSGIFTEAVLVGITCIFAILFMIFVKRNMSATARKVAIAGAAIFGVILSFSAGASYMMSSRAVWNTVLLPLGYLGTAVPTGIGLYMLVVALRKEEFSEYALFGKALIGGGILAAILAGVYVGTLAAGGYDVLVLGWLLSVVVCGVCPAALGAAMQKKPESVLALAGCSVACALVGSVAFRCLMWVCTSSVANYFGQI